MVIIYYVTQIHAAFSFIEIFYFLMYAESAIFFSVYILIPITVAPLIVKSYYSYFCPFSVIACLV